MPSWMGLPMRYGLKAVFYYVLLENDHTIEISGQTSEELTPRRGTKSNRLRFDPYCLKFNPLNNRIYTSGYRIRIRSYTRKQDCHGQLPAFLSKLAGDLFLFLSAFSTRESLQYLGLLSQDAKHTLKVSTLTHKRHPHRVNPEKGNCFCR